MIDEFICSEFQHEEPSDEGRDVEGDNIDVDHFAGIAAEQAVLRRVGWLWREGRCCTVQKEGRTKRKSKIVAYWL